MKRAQIDGWPSVKTLEGWIRDRVQPQKPAEKEKQ
jgi:hypothetical protein